MELIALGASAAFVLFITLICMITFRRSKQREAARRQLLELSDERDLFDIYNAPHVDEALWRPMANALLPGELHALTPEDIQLLGLKVPHETFLSRQEHARWFFIPSHSSPSVVIGFCIPLEGMPPQLTLHSERGRSWLGMGDFSLTLTAPEILAHKLAHPFWDALDRSPTPGLEQTTFSNISPAGLMRVGRTIKAKTILRSTGWSVQRLRHLLEQELDCLQAAASALSFSPPLDERASIDDVLRELLLSSSRSDWPATTQKAEFAARLSSQRRLLCGFILEHAHLLALQTSYQLMLTLTTHPQHEWVRAVLTEHDGAHHVESQDTRLALCVAWLARYQDPNHGRVRAHFACMDASQLDDFTRIVMSGLSAGEVLVHANLSRLSSTLPAPEFWGLIAPWLATHPESRWGWIFDWLSSQLWDEVRQALERGDVGAVKLITYHPQALEHLTPHIPTLTAAQRQVALGLHQRRFALPAELLEQLLRSTTPAMLKADHKLAILWHGELSRLPLTRLAASPPLWEPLLIACLTPELPTSQSEQVIKVLGHMGGRAALFALVACSKSWAPRALGPALERARADILQRTPGIEAGALTLSLHDDARGALTQAHEHGALALIPEESEPSNL